MVKYALWQSYAWAGILVCVLLLQLVLFERYVGALQALLQTNSIITDIFAVTLLLLELLSLPVLLRLRLSPLARAISTICVFITPIVWAIILVLAGI